MQDDWGLDFGVAVEDNPWQDDGFTPYSPSNTGQERFHLALFICALLGGILAAIIGQVIYRSMYDSSGNNVVMVGLILAIISAFVLLGCTICELIRPRITMNRELSLPRILFGLLVAAVVFVTGCLCELIYEWNSAYSVVSFDDYIFVIDDSESMSDTDPLELRYSALEELLDTLDQNHRTGLVRFNDNIYASVDMAELDETHRARLSEELGNSRAEGGTNIYGALEASLDMYRSTALSNRFPAVVLLSDGYDSGGYNGSFRKTVKDYLKEGVAISTVSLGENADEALLENLAQATGGQYFKVSEASDLAEAFQRVTTAVMYRCLFSPRPGIQRGSMLYMILRILFLSLPGFFIGLFVLLLLQNRLANPQLLVSGAAGLLSAVVMEAGTFFFLPLVLTQVVSWILYSVVLLRYCDSVSGIYQGRFEGMDCGFGDDWSSQPISTGTSDITRIKERKLGKIDRSDDWRFH